MTNSIPFDDYGFADHDIAKAHEETKAVALELRTAVEDKQKIEVIIDAAHQLLRQWETGTDKTLQQAATDMRAVMVSASVLYHPRGKVDG